MADTTGNSDVILRDARRSLQTQREGGYHRRAGRGRVRPIGRGSSELRRKNLLTRVKLIALSLLAILAASAFAGLVLDGIGFAEIVVTVIAAIAAVLIFGNFPRMKTPRRADLARVQDARQLVARTELWLEHQRAALPPPAVTLVDRIGVQLDALGVQLEHVDPAHPVAQETRKLVGEHLPETIDSYRRIPDQLRREERAGSSPDAQLVESLGKISGEIDHVTRQLAEGSLDELAVRNRYLDYKYGGAVEGPPEEN